jgi:glycosyltransferase involved in cell wall biosynthesis
MLNSENLKTSMHNPALYLDETFARATGGDKNRSRFLWDALLGRSEARWIEVRKPGITQPDTGPIHPALSLQASRAHFWSSQSMRRFGAGEHRMLRELSRKEKPAFLFARFYSSWELIRTAEAERVPIIVDVDMLSSRLVHLAWRQNPRPGNRYFLFETWKLRLLEQRLFRRPYLFLFTNPVELTGAGVGGKHICGAGKAVVVPNFMPAQSMPAEQNRGKRPVVLFFGSLDSGANVDAVRFLAREIFPRLAPDLERHGAELHLVGKNPAPAVRKLVSEAGNSRLRLVGPVDSIEQSIAESRLVLLPIRVASGTRTRILEAGALGKAVVTTTLGAEGLDLTSEAVCVRDTADGLAAAVGGLLQEPRLACQLGEQLQKQCHATYNPEIIARNLWNEIDAYLARWQACDW